MASKRLGKVQGLDKIRAGALSSTPPAARRRVQAEPDKQLTVMLPASVVRAVRIAAAEKGETLRATVLRAFQAAGIEVSESEITDRRLEANRRRVEA